MASEEMVEELEKALEDLQFKVSDMQTMHTSMERNLRLEIETLKAEKFEQDIQMNGCARTTIIASQTKEARPLESKAMTSSTLPNQNSFTLERRRKDFSGFLE